jgi:hypothetical protein
MKHSPNLSSTWILPEANSKLTCGNIFTTKGMWNIQTEPLPWKVSCVQGFEITWWCDCLRRINTQNRGEDFRPQFQNNKETEHKEKWNSKFKVGIRMHTVAHICNPSNSRGRDLEDHSWRPAEARPPSQQITKVW